MPAKVEAFRKNVIVSLRCEELVYNKTNFFNTYILFLTGRSSTVYFIQYPLFIPSISLVKPAD
jgi:hypothetical protein